MTFRENIVISNIVLVAFAVFAVAQSEGILTEWSTLGAFLLVAVVAFALPQLYFAVSREDHLSSVRIRLVPVVLLVLAVCFSLLASPWELLGIWLVVGVAVLGLLRYELRAGSLSTR